MKTAHVPSAHDCRARSMLARISAWSGGGSSSQSIHRRVSSSERIGRSASASASSGGRSKTASSCSGGSGGVTVAQLSGPPYTPASNGSAGGPSSNSRRMSCGSRRGANCLVRSVELVERPPSDLVHVLRGQVELRGDLVGLDAHDVVALDLPDEVLPQSKACTRVHTQGPIGASIPVSSSSSRRNPSSCVSPSSSAPPGVAHQPASVCGWRKCTSRIRSSGSRTIARAAIRSCGTRSAKGRPQGQPRSRASRRNQRSRSAYGTAAFAGEVDGRT